MTGSLASPRLRQLARGGSQPLPELDEHCELCGEPISSEHRHVVDVASGQLLCACRACTVLFDRRAAGGGHFRLVPERRLRLDDFELQEVTWERLRIPVDMAFFFHSTRVERVMAFYPSPMGATESLLELEAWGEIESANPVLGSIEPDVEALLVNRAHGERTFWLVPIDDCYVLVATIRTRWKGLTGGREVWEEIRRFFDELNHKATAVPSGAAGGR